jgi:hypothetical protein
MEPAGSDTRSVDMMTRAKPKEKSDERGAKEPQNNVENYIFDEITPWQLYSNFSPLAMELRAIETFGVDIFYGAITTSELMTRANHCAPWAWTLLDDFTRLFAVACQGITASVGLR